MKISKKIIVIILIVILLFVAAVARTAYTIGQHNASFTVKEVTPKQLAESMQQDNFYGEYIRTMLLVTGTVKEVTTKNQDTIVQFTVTNSPSVLGKVSCDLGNNQKQVKTGDTIRVLTVAYDAERKNGTDIFMPNCYLLKE